MVTPHQFVAGQEIVYVCYGGDPTFTKRERPIFYLHTVTVRLITKDGLGMRLEGSRGRCEIAHFARRSALPGDNSRIEAIIKEMAQQQVREYRYQAQPHVWKPGKVTQAELDKLTAVAKQFEDGDYAVKS